MKSLHFIVVVFCVVSIACEAPPLRSTNSANAEVKVDIVTEFDGIRLYEVHLGDRTVFVAARIDRVSVSWNELEGKIDVPRRVDTVR